MIPSKQMDAFFPNGTNGATGALTFCVYIVPAWSDQAGQCRIVGRHVSDEVAKTLNARDSYREAPNLWAEVGHMTSAGKLGSFSGSPALLEELVNCEPLMAGIVFKFPSSTLETTAKLPPVPQRRPKP